jgi:4-hydroxymandelate oxidase
MMMDLSEITLEEVRAKAKEKLKGFCMVYKDCDGDPNRFCQGQHYGRPLGFGGIGSGASFHNNWIALRNIKLKMELISDHFEPNTQFKFFDKNLTMPIMGASVSGVNSFGGEEVITEGDFCHAVVHGCKDAGALGWRGDTYTYHHIEACHGLNAIKSADGWGVKIVKPRAQEEILKFFNRAEEVGATAVGVDTDGCGSYMMNRYKKPVYRKSQSEIQDLVESTKLPLIIKGIMSSDDAISAVKAGAAAIVVSNHGGRVLDHTPGTAEVLPAIVNSLEEQDIPIYIDGGIRTGYDVLKVLALGADAVLIGRDIVRAAVGGGKEGVRLQMDYLRSTLTKAMKMTGCSCLAEISPDIIDTP